MGVGVERPTGAALRADALVALGETMLEVGLGARFHHRLVHEGGFGLTVGPHGAVAISRPGGDPIPQAPVTRVPGGEELIGLHARLGPPSTPTPP